MKQKKSLILLNYSLYVLMNIQTISMLFIYLLLFIIIINYYLLLLIININI